MTSSTKSNAGNFLEDFYVGMQLVHSTPLTLSHGDIALYRAMTGSRFAIHSSEPFANSVGLAGQTVDPLLAFHVVFGKTVPDISLNAVANLGYAEVIFHLPVRPGDTLRAVSEVIGVKQNSNGKTGVVYVRTTGLNQNEDVVLSYVRWVMVNKRDIAAPAPDTVIPELDLVVDPQSLSFERDYAQWDFALSGSDWVYEDYTTGEKINHVDGMAVEEAEHQIATRLYQNTAKVHFDAFGQKETRFGRRLIYGGVVISVARALSFNGLENAAEIIAINGGTHTGPLFSGDTIYAWSEVLDKVELSSSIGALRLRLVAVKDQDAASFPLRDDEGRYAEGVCLDLDYWAAIPRRS